MGQGKGSGEGIRAISQHGDAGLKLSEAKMTAGVLRSLKPFMQSCGLDLKEISDRIGFDPNAAMESPSGFMSLEILFWLLECGASETGDDAFGLHFAEKHNNVSTGLVYFIVNNCPTLRDLYKARIRYSKLVSNGYSFKFDECNGIGVCSWHYRAGLAPHNQFIDYAVTLAIERVRILLGADWMPTEVSIEHPTPTSKSEFERVLGPSVRFGKSPTSFAIESAWLDTALPDADDALLRELERVAEGGVGPTDTPRVLEQTSVLIAKLLPNGVPTIATVAARLGLSPRTLQRRLVDHATGYRELVWSVQNRMARHLLIETDLPLVEIAFLLGFSESSGFSRAARVWLGEPPHEFRIRHRIRSSGSVS